MVACHIVIKNVKNEKSIEGFHEREKDSFLYDLMEDIDCHGRKSAQI